MARFLLAAVFFVFGLSFSQACNFVPGCSYKMCTAAVEGDVYGTPGVGGFNREIFVTKSGSTYSQTLAGTLLAPASGVSTVTSCCKKCSDTDGCARFQFYLGAPNPQPPTEYVSGVNCYLLKDGPNPIVPTRSEQAALLKTYSWSYVGGRCNPNGKICCDPHLVGARGTHYDFNGELDKSFCLITDSSIHINALLRGYESNMTDGATVTKNGKGLRSWIKEMSFIWHQSSERIHKLKMVARSGKQQERGNGFLESMEVDGTPVELQVAESYTGPAGLTVTFTGVERKGPFDLDVYRIKIASIIDTEVKLRIAHPAMQTELEAYTHLSLNVKRIENTDLIHGVIGQTYRPDREREERAQKYQAISHLLHANIQADGETGGGFLDGKVADYSTTSLLSTDCKFSTFAT
eukprot:TRINITY_DN17964_c0_g1_i1.p1 TRINITY_DN17964_c0_g1~~TRINITY_DN17964_c0_g1_i1.p1  ORF type:complete len:406 (+),score=72.77 TRINITY_DN17964_c0_g1_i1:63-1280(+)